MCGVRIRPGRRPADKGRKAKGDACKNAVSHLGIACL
jgi:hypothetical protein